MPDLVPLTGVAAGIAIAAFLFYYFLLRWWLPPVPVAPGAVEVTVRAGCEAPDEPFTVAEAHSTMQQHIACRREDCPRKAAAYQTLVETGYIQPDVSRTR